MTPSKISRLECGNVSNQRAIVARYIRKHGIITVSLDSGLELRFRADLVAELRQANHKELAEIEISPSGQGLHWSEIDVHLSIPGILRGKSGPERQAS